MSEARSITLHRAFDASPEDVFRLWTDPALVSQWWGIKGSTIDGCHLDVRVGGRWHIEMRTASGRVYPNGGTYLEVVPNERIVFLNEPDPAIPEWNPAVTLLPLTAPANAPWSRSTSFSSLRPSVTGWSAWG